MRLIRYCTRLLGLGAIGVAAACGGSDTSGAGGSGGAGVKAGSTGSGAEATGSNGAGSSSGHRVGSGPSSASGSGAASGASGSGATVGSGGADASCGPDTSKHGGDATYYNADGSGNCSFDATPNDLMVGAMNHVDYAASAVCGSCVHMVGPSGDAVVRIVDQCPECNQGDIDLSQLAFSKLAAVSLGRVHIDWTYVACEVTGPIDYHFKDGSNAYWTAVQVRNARYAIAKFEVMKGGQYADVARVDYNFFVDTSGMGPGPYQFRVTDVKGHVLTDSGIPLGNDSDTAGTGQFPECEGD